MNKRAHGRAMPAPQQRTCWAAWLRLLSAALLVLPAFGFAPSARMSNLQEEENKSVRWSEEELKHGEAIPARAVHRSIAKRTLILSQIADSTPVRGYDTSEPYAHERLDLRNGAGLCLLC